MRAAAPRTLHGADRSARRFLLGLCLFLAVAAPACMFFGVRGFAPVVGLCGLVCIPFARPRREDWRGIAVLAILVGWAWLSLSWSPAPGLSLNGASGFSRLTALHLALLVALCAAFVVALERLDRTGAERALRWIAFGALAAPPLLVEEALNNWWLYEHIPALIHQQVRVDKAVARLGQAGFVIAVMAWPLGVALYRQGRLGLAIALWVFVPLSAVLLRGSAAAVALGLSAPVFILTLRRGRGAVEVLAVLTATYLLATPLAMFMVDHLGLYLRLKTRLWPSWSDRLRIWSFISERFAEHPLRGAGLDASRAFPGIVPLHPHNAPLQLWYELGLPGAALGTLFWRWLWRRIDVCARRDPLYGAAAAATAATYLCISSVSFGLWQDWWLCVGALAMALCILLGKALDPKTE